MQPPDELMVQRFLPALRLLVTRSLRHQGYSQNDVSSLLGVTQASVSLYDSSKVQKAYDSLSSLNVAKDDADRYVALLVEDLKRSPAYAVETLRTVWAGLLGRGAVCDAHRRQYPSLATCDVCMRQYQRQAGESPEVLAQVAAAVKVLESSEMFARVMPQVSVNIACLSGESESLEDVVAIPGRIVKVRGRAKALEPPAAGASRHLAGMLLLARRRQPKLRAVVNIRYDSRVSSVLKRLGLKTIEIGGYARSENSDSTLVAFASSLTESAGDFEAVVDAGSRGIEPNAYIFGADPVFVSRLAVRISEMYSAG